MKSKISRVFYTFILAAGLFIMISPLPEGTLILSFVLSLFGYRFSGGSLWAGIITYMVTFPVTIILIRKLGLVGKFQRELRRMRNC